MKGSRYDYHWAHAVTEVALENIMAFSGSPRLAERFQCRRAQGELAFFCPRVGP
jgi:hypothetical protein